MKRSKCFLTCSACATLFRVPLWLLPVLFFACHGEEVTTEIERTGAEGALRDVSAGAPTAQPEAGATNAPVAQRPDTWMDTAGGASKGKGVAAGDGNTNIDLRSTQPLPPGLRDKAVEASLRRAKAGPGYNQKDYPPDFDLEVVANGTGRQSLYELVGPTATSPVDGVVVTFVASWCGRCKAALPTLESLQKKYGDRLRILLLTTESDPQDVARVAKLLDDRKIDLPLLEAPKDVYGVWLGAKRNIPRFYLLDYKGQLRVKDTGFGGKMKKLLPRHVAWLLARREHDSVQRSVRK